MKEYNKSDKLECDGCLVNDQCVVFLKNRIICPCKLCILKMICEENTCKEYENIMIEQESKEYAEI